MQPAFTRGFRLHHNGQVLDGAEFPSGRTFVIDDPEYGLATVTSSMEHLLKGYHGARIERAPAADVERVAAALRKHYLCTNRDEADADGNMPCRCGDWREPGPMGSDEDDWDSHLAAVALSVLPAPAGRAAEETVTRVIDLYERWLKAGPPPIGTSMARWWDARLIELHDAIRPADPVAGAQT